MFMPDARNDKKSQGTSRKPWQFSMKTDRFPPNGNIKKLSLSEKVSFNEISLAMKSTRL